MAGSPRLRSGYAVLARYLERVPVHRLELPKLSRARLREAKALAAAGEWSGAYYLSGYAVECGLKAAIARAFNASTFPDKNHVFNIHTHKLQDLVKLAGLQPQQDLEFQATQTSK